MTFCPYNLVEIDLNALYENYKKIQDISSKKGAKIIAVVKSDAYGHGLCEVAKRLYGERGLWGFGVSEVWEGELLRSAGIDSPILLLSGALTGDEERAIGLNLTISLNSIDEIKRLSERAGSLGKTARCHIKIDTGMNRFGMEWDEYLYLIKHPHILTKNIKIDGIFSHLACSDDPSDTINIRQINAFKEAISLWTRNFGDIEIAHLLNSYGIIHFKHAMFSGVRPGIALYGGLKNFLPVMSFKSRIRLLKRVKKGMRIGYGGAWKAKRDSIIAIIPVGYDNGYIRSINSSNDARVIINGSYAPLCGRISMRSMAVDVTDLHDNCSIGDQVILIGKDNTGNCSITPDEVAKLANTISYELLCLIGSRNKRVYIEDKDNKGDIINYSI